MAGKIIEDMIEDSKSGNRPRIKEKERGGLRAQIRQMEFRGVPKDIQLQVLRLSQKQYRSLKDEIAKDQVNSVKTIAELGSIVTRVQMFDDLIMEAVDKVYSAKPGTVGVGYLNAARALIESRHKFLMDVGIIPELRAKYEASRRRGRRTLEEIRQEQEKVLNRLKKFHKVELKVVK